MGGFFFAPKKNSTAWQGIVAESRRQFQRSGFAEPLTFETASCVIDYYKKIDYPSIDHVILGGDDFVFSVGTFIYHGRIGSAALRLLHAESDPLTALADARGHFILVMRKDREIWLYRDRTASQELLFDPTLGCISSSFLALACAVPGRRVSPHEVYEYVFNGATLGTATVLAGLRRIDLNEWVQLEPGPELVRQPRIPCPPERIGSRADLIERNLENLLDYARELASLFGDNIRQALSGGYDSRFLLAVFRHVGVNPSIFVGGPEHSSDVRIAKHIAAAEHLHLRLFDELQINQMTPDCFPQTVATNFNYDDGVPWNGIFNSGAGHLVRSERKAGGALHVNGGGGEIYRNFFNLFDRPIEMRDFVWVFYRQFNPAVCTDRFDHRAYDGAIVRKVADLLGLEDTRLPRRMVECLYPYLRCRSWVGPDNSINSRYGYSIVPFYDYRIVDEALRVPLRYKHFGNFEAAMMRRADPVLAAYQSNYGHGFDRDTPLPAAARTMLFDYLRPMRFRGNSFRIKAMLSRTEPLPQWLSPPFLDCVLVPGFPYMSRYFRVDRVSSQSQFARLCTLEYLFQTLSVHDP